MPIKSRDPCGRCDNRDLVKFRHYKTRDEELIGKYCTKCNVEWVKLDYHHLTQSNPRYWSVNSDPARCTGLYENTPIKPEVNTAFQVQSARTKIDTRYFAEILKQGDHITWHRKKGIWHHSIVSDVNGDNNEIVVIHWTKKGAQLQIIEESMEMNTSREESLFNQMYRIDYDDKIKNANRLELILARARSRIGDTGYKLFKDNCEAFATYCKTGYSQSHQVEWVYEKMNEIIGSGTLKTVSKKGAQFLSKIKKGVPLVASEVIPAELMEEVMSNSQTVGVGILVLTETGHVIWDLSEAYRERKEGKISRRDFVEAAIRGVVEGMASAGLASLISIPMESAGAALLGGIFGPVGAIMGGIIGGVIGGIAGGAIGRIIGTWGGSVAGKIIAGAFQDDRAVKKVSELNPGDHIVMKGWFFHPRCHAIVLDYDEKGNILVIRNTYQHGVVKEWMKFEQPLFRVEYKIGECLDPERVIRNAKSKIGQTWYDLGLYNCKTFARECKTRGGATGGARRQLPPL
ncbi:uncharacterized protein [Amphiura filiformis]|uniref:uncharacterized protein n=1 Tax=Amphiura filiformis TaxID=82378 RepID=UPI003B21E015